MTCNHKNRGTNKKNQTVNYVDGYQPTDHCNALPSYQLISGSQMKKN